jgi:hypothetical protein
MTRCAYRESGGRTLRSGTAKSTREGRRAGSRWFVAGPSAAAAGKAISAGSIAAQHGVHAELAQSRLVHRRVEAVDAEVGIRREPPDVGKGLHRDAGGRVHAYVDGDDARIGENLGIELLQ